MAGQTHRQSPAGQRAFTLIELSLSLCLLGLILLLSAAAPARSLASRWRSREGAATAMGILRGARWLAITENREYGVLFSRPRPADPWQATLQRKDTGRWVAARAPLCLPQSITSLAVTGPSRKEFNADGTSSGGSIIIACAGGARYRISLTTATGRIRLYREPA